MEKVKKILNLIWNEFVYGGHLIAFVGLMFVWCTIILLNKKVNWEILLISYLIPQIVYSYNYFKEIKMDLITNPERANYLQKIKKFFPFIFFFYFFLLFLLLILFTNLNTIGFVILLILGGILFTTTFKKMVGKLIGVKSFYASFFWTSAGTFLPLFYYSLSFKFFFFFLFLFYFLRLLLNAIFFDIKDIESDKIQELRTLPVIIGKENTLKFLHFLNFFSFFPLILGVYLEIFPIFSLILVLFYFYSVYYLKKAEVTTSKNLRYFSYLMVDGEYILWPLVLILAKIFIS